MQGGIIDVGINELDLELIRPNKKTVNVKSRGFRLVVIGKPGCFRKDTEIMMYDGKLKKVQDIVVGDKLMGDDCSKRTVMELCSGNDVMYSVDPDIGESYVVNSKHKLVLKEKNKMSQNDEIKEIEVEKCYRSSLNKIYNIYNNCVVYNKSKKPDIDPYIYGLLLIFQGDKNKIIKVADMVPYVKKKISLAASNKKLDNFINMTNLSFVKENFIITSVINRLNLLASFIDFSSVIEGKIIKLIIEDKKILEGMYRVCCSLGYICEIKNNNIILHRGIYIPLSKTNALKCMCEDIVKIDNVNMRKLNDINQTVNYKNVKSKCIFCSSYGKDKIYKSFTIKKLEVEKYYGFTIDGNHRFLLGSCDVVRNTGKTSLLTNLLSAKSGYIPVGLFMSGTEEYNGHFGSIAPDLFVYNDLDEKRLYRLKERQDLAIKYLKNPWAVCVVDDCTDDPKILDRPIFQDIFKNGRHWQILFILSLQYCLDIKPRIRNAIDGVFILREANIKTRKKLWENYASIIPDFSMFCEIMDDLTGNFTAIYIDNTSQSNDYRDCIYYYEIVEGVEDNLKFGCIDYYKFHEKRYNSQLLKK